MPSVPIGNQALGHGVQRDSVTRLVLARYSLALFIVQGEASRREQHDDARGSLDLLKGEGTSSGLPGVPTLGF